MIAMEMADEDVVDFAQARLLRGGKNALGVAVLVRITGIDQERFAGRRHHQGGGAAFGIDPGDVEILGLRAGIVAGHRHACDGHRQSTKSNPCQSSFHRHPPFFSPEPVEVPSRPSRFRLFGKGKAS